MSLFRTLHFFSRLYPTQLSTQQLVDASHFEVARQNEEGEHILYCISREVWLSQQSWSLWDRFPCIRAVCFLSLFCSVLIQPSPITACCVSHSSPSIVSPAIWVSMGERACTHSTISPFWISDWAWMSVYAHPCTDIPPPCFWISNTMTEK